MPVLVERPGVPTLQLSTEAIADRLVARGVARTLASRAASAIADNYDLRVTDATLDERLAASLPSAIALAWHGATPPAVASDGSRGYSLAAPPPEAISADRVFIREGSATMVWSHYLPLGDADAAALRERANGFLAELARAQYAIAWPTSSVDRPAFVARTCSGFTSLLRAAESFAFADATTGAHVALAPGEVPTRVASALADFLRDVTRDDALDYDRLKRFAGFLGVPPGEAPASEAEQTRLLLDEVAPPTDAQLVEMATRLHAGEPVGWWYEPGQAEGLTTVREPSAARVVISPIRRALAPPPHSTTIDILDGFGAPIALSLSDLHVGQRLLGAAIDNADNTYANLEAAYIQVIDSWSIWVQEHRKNQGDGPAYLVLNGDVLDFWSADLRVDGAGLPLADVAGADTPSGTKVPRVTPTVSAARMERILGNHKPFFDRITRWIDESPLNFCIYVCGNHDDHLVRFGLGATLARRLHPTRATFAGEYCLIPQLRALFEHGHRNDAWNNPSPSLGFAGSFGELLVSLFVNPIARGGVSSVSSIDAMFPGAGVAAGMTKSDVGALTDNYRILNKAFAINQEIYQSWMGTIDNIIDEAAFEGVGDCAAAKLHDADSDAADSDIYSALPGKGLDSVVVNLFDGWLSDQFQDLLTRVGTYMDWLPSGLKGFLLSLARESPRRRLGYHDGDEVGRGGGLGPPDRIIHVVGHTHEPASTYPPLAGREVWSQHINTGTGMDYYYCDDGTFSDDETAIPKSQAAILELRADDPKHIYVYGPQYRSLQSPDRPSLNPTVHGGLSLSTSRFNRVVIS